MKKKLALLGVVILIALVTATTAMASHDKQSFTIGGTITDIVGDWITVQTVKGSVDVKVDDDTIYKSREADGVFVIIEFADLVADLEDNQSTNIKYYIDDDGYKIATQVKVDVPLNCR